MYMASTLSVSASLWLASVLYQRGMPHKIRRRAIGHRRRTPFATAVTPEHRVNQYIRIASIRVIGPDGDQLGVMTPEQGRHIAQEHGLDLVEVAPQARPPVCRVMDYGKFRYEQSKKKTTKPRVDLKTLRLRPKTDDHDLDNKLKKAVEFLSDGHKVKLQMRLRGRERAYMSRWISHINALVDKLDARFQDELRVIQNPSPQGRDVTVVVEPVPA